MCNDNMSDLIRKAKNEYHNKWRKQNHEKVEQAQKRYWEKKAKELQSKERNKNNVT